MTTPNDPRVDDLRQRLRSLGYLDAGVDRFVLGPARDARRPVAIAALASLRIGVLAAVLLGPAAAIGIGTRLPGLVTGTRDALVVAVYLALLFGTAATALSFVASLVAARLPATLLGRRARLVSRAAGVLVGAGCLVYLTLWWRIANANAALLSPLWTVFVLLVAVGISLLLGHATSITAFAVMAARGGNATARVDRTPAWRLTAAAAVVAFAGAAGLLLLAAPAPASETPAPHLAVISSGVRVKLVAIDGFDPAALDALAPTGRVRRWSVCSATARSGLVLTPFAIRRGNGRPLPPGNLPRSTVSRGWRRVASPGSRVASRRSHTASRVHWGTLPTCFG